MAEERKALAYVGYVIDRGIPFDGIQKAVDFFDGVGILDYEALAGTAPHWFDRNTKGELVLVHANATPMQVFVDYWTGLGCKVTPVSEAEATEIKVALAAKQPIDPKYLKAAVDTRGIAGGAAKEPTPASPAPGPGDNPPTEPPRGRGKK